MALQQAVEDRDETITMLREALRKRDDALVAARATVVSHAEEIAALRADALSVVTAAEAAVAQQAAVAIDRGAPGAATPRAAATEQPACCACRRSWTAAPALPRSCT